MSSGAQRRLLADLRELERQPLPMVSARPLEHDLFTWHCNLMGPENTPYAGGLFHFVLSFPQTYPNKPPSARVLSPIPHPHVHGDLVCLDLLSDYASYFLSVDSGEKVLGTGWSSAYSVQTILLQMQAFLMELGDESDMGPYNDEAETVGLEVYLRRIPKAIQQARAFSCLTCPHLPGCPWPPVVTTLEINRRPKREADIIREELVCFHSRRHFTEDVLGIDISLIWNNRKNEPSEINTNLDLLSHSAYAMESVRQTVMGDAFTHWLPLYVNEEHGARADALLKKSLSKICSSSEDRFRPEMAFETLSKLCNTMVVNVMSERTHASLKALSGYCAFQRLILHFAKQYPSLVKAANNMVDRFVEDESYRTKEVVKALGEFLPLLTITGKSWKDIALAYLHESFDRNVRWMLQKHPMLATTQPDPLIDEKRYTLTFESSVVSLRLLLFHVYFLENVSRPEGMSLEDIAQGYDAMYGMPSAKMKESLQEACKQIQQVSSWDEYFARIGIDAPSREELIEWLRRSVANSARKGYHDPRKFRRWLTEQENVNVNLSLSNSSVEARGRGRSGDRDPRGRRSGSAISLRRSGSPLKSGSSNTTASSSTSSSSSRSGRESSGGSGRRGSGGDGRSNNDPRDRHERGGLPRSQSAPVDSGGGGGPAESGRGGGRVAAADQQGQQRPRQPVRIDPYCIGDRRRRRDNPRGTTAPEASGGGPPIEGSGSELSTPARAGSAGLPYRNGTATGRGNNNGGTTQAAPPGPGGERRRRPPSGPGESQANGERGRRERIFPRYSSGGADERWRRDDDRTKGGGGGRGRDGPLMSGAGRERSGGGGGGSRGERATERPTTGSSRGGAGMGGRGSRPAAAAPTTDVLTQPPQPRQTAPSPTPMAAYTSYSAAAGGTSVLPTAIAYQRGGTTYFAYEPALERRPSAAWPSLAPQRD